MNKPIILITGGPAYDPRFHLESRMLNKTYTSAVFMAGGIPIMDLDNSAMEDYLELADGFIFTGTHHFTPSEALDLQELQYERIVREHEFMRSAVERRKPILGICQGMQQLNVACGGSIKNYFKEQSGVEHYYTWHSVKAVKESMLYRLYGEEFVVNSIHNVMVDELAPCFRATAFSPDGVIESYEHKELPVFGFQWHPERMRGDFPDMPYGPDTDLIFKEFIGLCSVE